MITPEQLAHSVKESFALGEKAERERILDLIADQNCGHKGCRECGTYEFLLDLITLKERLQ
jgi:hypothetical protein